MSTAKLAEKVEELKTLDVGKNKPWEKMTEEERIARAKEINSQTFEEIEEPVMAIINGQPMALVENKYIPWDDAQLAWQEYVVKRETEKLNFLKLQNGN